MPMLFNPLLDKKPGSLGARLLFAIASQSGNRTHSGGGSGGGGGGAELPQFEFQAETVSAIAAILTPPTVNRQRQMDRTVRRLKTSGIWTKARWLRFQNFDEDSSLLNWRVPSEKAIEVGTAPFVADQHYAGNTGLNYINLGMNANVLQQNNLGMFVWYQTGHMKPTAAQSGSTMGVINASSQGLSIVPNNAGQINLRCGGTNIVTAGTQDGFGLVGASRFNSADVQVYSNGVLKNTFSNASAALPALPVYLCGLNNNGSITNGNVVTQSFLYLGEALTEAEVRTLTAIVGEWLEHIRYGDYYFEEPGIGTTNIDSDGVAYGLTGQSVCWAVQLKRANPALKVDLIGGWRDRFTFGMAGGGLGFTDFDTIQLGGLPRYIITDMNLQEGVTDDHVANGIAVFKFAPKRFNRTMMSLLKTFGINVYLTGGVDSVDKTGTVINSFHTADGRTVTASQFFDGSYEGDLMRMAGCTYFKGREAAGTGIEANNGVEAIANTAQPLDGIGGAINVDPWVTPATPGSGLLPGVHVISSTFSPGIHNYPATGSTDTKIPAYNFRLTFTTTSDIRCPLPTTPPPGFNAANFELLLRQIAAAGANPMTIATLFKVDNLRATNRFDLNNSGVFGTNLTGGTWDYPLGDYALRETIWKNVWNHILGMWYVLQHHNDARINGSALRTEALTWGFCMDHYYSPHENDAVFHMPQLYVREAVRMQSDIIMNANHMDQTDGQVPTLGDKTVSVASYQMDSHSVQRAAQEVSAGVWTTRGEGGMLENSGGANDVAPLPLGIFVPKVSEVTNLSIAFGCSTTHVSYGTTRMEFTAMQTGQSMGQCAAYAIANATTIQAVDYPTVRAALLASPSLAGEVAPVLPQLT